MTRMSKAIATEEVLIYLVKWYTKMVFRPYKNDELLMVGKPLANVNNCMYALQVRTFALVSAFPNGMTTISSLSVLYTLIVLIDTQIK